MIEVDILITWGDYVYSIYSNYFTVCPWPRPKGNKKEEYVKSFKTELLHTIVGFTRIAVNFKFHSWFANFKLT